MFEVGFLILLLMISRTRESKLTCEEVEKSVLVSRVDPFKGLIEYRSIPTYLFGG